MRNAPSRSQDHRGRSWGGLTRCLEIRRRLEAAGFTEHSQKGSHVKFVRARDLVVDTVIVPKKSEIPVGTLRLSQAHINPDDWERLR